MSSAFPRYKVVKINMKTLIFGIIFLMIAVPMAYADKLLIDKLDVKVGDRWSRNVDDGETVSREAEPGDDVDFKIKFKNNFTDAEDLKIEDITATVTIEEIDDGEDLDEESKEFDIREDDDKTVTISFKVPIEVEEDTFDVKIEAEGEDENGTDHSVEFAISLEVEKEEHELRFYRKTLSPSEIKAGKIASLNVGIINTGSEDEEDIELIISNSDIEYNTVVTISEITAEPFEDESKYTKTFRIEVPKTAEPGVYPINIKVTYDNGDETLEDSVDLIVTKAEEVEEEKEEEKKDEEEVVVVQQPTTTAPTTAAVVTQPTVTQPTTATEEKPFFQTGWFIGLLIFGEIVIIVIAILLVMALVRRKAG